MDVWDRLARWVEFTYVGSYVDWEEGFFVCPECGEPIYKLDWRNEDYFLNGDPWIHRDIICPVCENVLREHEEEEEDED